MTEAEILAKRQRIDDLSVMGKRIGYSLYAIAIVLFFAPAIVMAYGVKAAVHEENGGGSFH